MIRELRTLVGQQGGDRLRGLFPLVGDVRLVLRRVALFIGLYLVIYGIGQLLIRLVDPQGLPELLLTSLIVLVATTPLIFLGGRYIFGRDSSPEKSIQKGGTPS